MANQQDAINQLLDKLEVLLKRQEDFSKEINNLRCEINSLKNAATELAPVKEDKNQAEPAIATNLEITSHKASGINDSSQPEKQDSFKQTPPPLSNSPKVKSDLEKFIGENLINKIGIAITVIGVAIGAKYSIEHGLISPLTRILLGYLAGLALLGFGIKLKKNYENYSAVLVSGAMAIMYFITFTAYAFYNLIPQGFAFALMVVFTVFTVVAALNYNRQVIAHIGLVGAYAVPFLLSNNSGKVEILFAYMAIINIGILVIAIKRYWKKVFYSAFGLTWFIFFVWYVWDYRTGQHFGLTLTFLCLFFGTFYLTFLAYKLLKNEKFAIEDIILLLANSFIFYGIGYNMLNNHTTGEQFLGLFTLCNAIAHLLVSTVVYYQKLADRNLFYLISGLVLVFITIAIPIQLNGNWVTLLWAGEAAVLFWIGRTNSVPFYEKLSYPLIFLAFFSIVHDWISVYDAYIPHKPETRITPLFNIHFLTSFLLAAAFGFINIVNRQKINSYAADSKNRFYGIMSYVMPAILLVTLYYAFRLEIANFWNQLFKDGLSSINSEYVHNTNYYRNYDLKIFKVIWIINYTLFFTSLLALVNLYKLKNKALGLISLGLITLTLVAFLTQGLYELSELRQSYLNQTHSQFYQSGTFNIAIRYISFAFVALAIIVSYIYIKKEFMHKNFRKGFDFLLHTTVLWIASSELINWMDLGHSTQSYKLGLTILWGAYSLGLIILGISQKKKHLRIGAISLFAITLLKLFFYDISHLDTLAKTIVFVSLGVLLLIISFLYNKYKHIISDEVIN